MRVIKFRAFEDGRMTEPFTLFDIGDDLGRTFIAGFGRVYEPVIMQFTGLKDKNGVDIYEGDILGYEIEDEKHMTCPVKYEVGWASIGAKIYTGVTLGGYYPEDLFLQYVDELKDTYEVVGNEFENPEMVQE